MSIQHNRKVSVIGLGYVGLPVAVAFGKQSSCLGFDINPQRINELNQHIDSTLEVDSNELRDANITFSSDATQLAQADFHIVSVPTPIDESKQPDLTPLIAASKTLGQHIKTGDIIVYESTVYPGTTEEVCAPILEQTSGLTCGTDFFIGYSPERINPGDKQHTFSKILKIVSGQTPEVLDIIADVYASVVEPGVHKASSIKVAEAAKVIENTQRDLNIALMNELAIIFNHMHIDTQEVLIAAGTKWNFQPFRPGLVGGHCIGVDPYYLTHKAEKLGYHPDIILAGRRINDGMGEYLANQIVKQMTRNDQKINNSRIGILGITFKENCPDIRNSKVFDVIRGLEHWGANVLTHDPQATTEDTEQEYNIKLTSLDHFKNLDAIVLCVAHTEYVNMPANHYKQLLKPNAIIFDIKSILDKQQFANADITLWRL